jgi:phosphatidylserine/phosphatidylglycerophosphate/cardiolipin synthase-like enzyme
VKNPLLSLAPSDLRALADALASGRLAPPYLPLSLQRVASSAIAGTLASSLQELAAVGILPSGLSRVLELLADCAAARPRLEDLVELVTTGPDSTGAATRDTSVVVRDLFHNAQDSVTVVGYAVHQGQKVFESLAQRMTDCPHLSVRMYLDIQRNAGDTSAPSELVARFAHNFRTRQWPVGSRLPKVFYDPRSLEFDRTKAAALHAKCVVVDNSELFVSSANFTEAAQHRNIEVGLLLRSPLIAQGLLHFLSKSVETGLFRQAF